MTSPDSLVNSTPVDAASLPLKRGTATKIAQRLGLSVHHVSEVVKDRREGSAELRREIRKERAKQARAAAREFARRAARVEAERSEGASRHEDVLPRSA